jgi:hypothetical protein
MLGKLRLALAPPLPERNHAPLALSARGMTTRALPHESGSIEASLDLVDHAIRLSRSDGRVETLELLPARPVAATWRAFLESLDRLGVEPDLWDKPQELTGRAAVLAG